MARYDEEAHYRPNGRRSAASVEVDAVLFDLDGVVTDTAKAHVITWKRLFDELLRARARANGEDYRPFDPDGDYREFLDGKPRQDGIRSFLRSRGIDLPEGSPDDPSGTDSMFGLGRRKQDYFHSWLEKNRVRVYPGTAKLVQDLRESGVRTAVFSSSRNIEEVLRNADALDLFDARVGGNDLEILELPGKPHPAMLHEAVSRLGVSPAQTAVVEDSVAGVKAGVRGGFGFVVGVNRGEYGDALRSAGADVVIDDLSELFVTGNRCLTVKTLESVPTVWDRGDDIHARLSGKELAVFLDYDGTLTPIVDDPGKALLGEDMRAALAGLAGKCIVTVISGRSLELLQRLVRVDSVFLAGSHGFEIAGPSGVAMRLERGTEFLSRLDEADRLLRGRLADIAGHEVERQRFSISVHYRRAAHEDTPRIEAIVDQILSECGGLRKGHGKMVFRVQPDIDWHKGHAVNWILQRFRRRDAGPFPVYVGDDLTDEDAFRALSGCGLTVAVRDHDSRRTAADCTVADVADVKRLIEMLTVIAAGRPTSNGDSE